MVQSRSPGPEHSPEHSAEQEAWWSGMLDRSWRTSERSRSTRGPDTPKNAISSDRSSRADSRWWSRERIRGSVWPVWSLTVLVAAVLVFVAVTPFSVWLHGHHASGNAVDENPPTQAGMDGFPSEPADPLSSRSPLEPTSLDRSAAPAPVAAAPITSTTTATATVTANAPSPAKTVTRAPQTAPAATVTVPAADDRPTPPDPTTTATATVTATVTAEPTADPTAEPTVEPTPDAPTWSWRR